MFYFSVLNESAWWHASLHLQCKRCLQSCTTSASCWEDLMQYLHSEQVCIYNHSKKICFNHSSLLDTCQLGAVWRCWDPSSDCDKQNQFQSDSSSSDAGFWSWVLLWDLSPGGSPVNIYNTVQALVLWHMYLDISINNPRLYCWISESNRFDDSWVGIFAVLHFSSDTDTNFVLDTCNMNATEQFWKIYLDEVYGWRIL